MKVILIIDVKGLEDKDLFEKHLLKEGFSPIEDEEFAYEGETTTHLNNTKAYIVEVVTKGLQKTNFETCKIIFQVGDNAMEAYEFNKRENTFSGVSVS
ncbi:hypothetical protein [Sulfurospirillum arcachonense]|uniref:hypothetical protein n=1 Tax=Sulfurospirillum arcachonense TaxID=57666 RepID=UPI000469E92D|nr:hypothetical protein [Sulfurospirillum arcachonense]